eukprot:c20529_g1_i1.p1 GENE.c20529_g1_i1~~c20529_g1_i1.p1  ORF type:complete len:389 (+),score=0.55 c20529_g1_i1:51-1217(+)
MERLKKEVPKPDKFQHELFLISEANLIRASLRAEELLDHDLINRLQQQSKRRKKLLESEAGTATGLGLVHDSFREFKSKIGSPTWVKSVFLGLLALSSDKELENALRNKEYGTVTKKLVIAAGVGVVSNTLMSYLVEYLVKVEASQFLQDFTPSLIVQCGVIMVQFYLNPSSRNWDTIGWATINIALRAIFLGLGWQPWVVATGSFALIRYAENVRKRLEVNPDALLTAVVFGVGDVVIQFVSFLESIFVFGSNIVSDIITVLDWRASETLGERFNKSLQSNNARTLDLIENQYEEFNLDGLVVDSAFQCYISRTLLQKPVVVFGHIYSSIEITEDLVEMPVAGGTPRSFNFAVDVKPVPEAFETLLAEYTRIVAHKVADASANVKKE